MASARSETGYQSSAPASGQLDFYEAMADFRTMFPKLDPDVIEAVLRANNGVVESTIDHLLKLNEGNEDFVPYRDVAREIPADLLPPSYDAATAATAAAAPATPVPPAAAAAAADPGARERACRKAAEAGVAPPEASVAAVVPDGGGYRNWKPPLLGALPDDFLRLTTAAAPSRGSSRGVGSRCRNCGRHHHHHRHHHRHTSARRHASAGAASSAVTGGPAPSTTAQPVAAKQSATLPAGLGASVLSDMDTVEGLLHRRLMENEMKRRGSAGAGPGAIDADVQQCLDDERMAIMLQNEEFLRMLRRDDDFMRALHSDRVSALTTTAISHDRASEPRPSECVNPQMANYLPSLASDERTGSLSLDQVKDENEELRHQLKHMGKSSKKKFADLAKRFFSMRYKKKPSNIPFYKTDLPTESTMNLLDDDEADEECRRHQQQQQQAEVQERRNERISFEPLPGALAALPSYRTVQRPMYHPDCVSTYHDDSKDMV